MGISSKEAIQAERARRLVHGPYHHWQERGELFPPPREHWCEFCAGYFGVPHQHKDNWCRFVGSEQCACIVCVVVEGRAERERWAQRIRQGETPFWPYGHT